jgi:probable F420-dependent oxidoreductase
MDLGQIGIWWSGSWHLAGDRSFDVPAALEELGYGALWSSGRFDPGLSPHFGDILAGASRAPVASGIVSIWAGAAPDVAAAVADLERRFPGRFLLGIGASHSLVVQDYTRPYAHMVAYLDALDGAETPVPRERRVLAALGPRMLELSAQRAAGAHPYFVPAEHTARARAVLGAGPLLAPEVAVVLGTDHTEARRLARHYASIYLGLENYTNNLRTLGYDDGDFADGGSDRLMDALIPCGDAAAIAPRVRAHLDAGADHVCLQVVADMGSFPLDQYRELASAVLGR